MLPKISIYLLQVRLLARIRYTSGLDYIKNVDIIAVIKTDHSAIVLHSQGFEETKKGLGFWKMNTSLLSDENFIHLMKTNLEIWKEERKEFSDKRVAWDWIKYKVRLF